ncbi:hypothetical protein ACFPIF_19865, partial [Brevundimonas faecalis]|uniref:hypothetical protein n=1 Tax=Brevundimonas faecalis TaxID=947378 RepID=UPI003617F89A
CATAYSPTAFEAWFFDGAWWLYSRPGHKTSGGVGKWFPTHWMPKPALATPAEAGERDAIARLVDPETFALIAGYTGIDRGDGLSPVEREPAVFKAYPKLQEDREAALRKADAILALRAQPQAREEAQPVEATGAKAVIRNDQIVISIDVDALPLILSGSIALNAVAGTFKVTDPATFAKEVCHALNAEKEDGTTRVHMMFDSAFDHAIDQGAEGVEEISDDEFEAEASRLQEETRTASDTLQAAKKHGPRCWGATSYSDEMAHCYCGTTPPAPEAEKLLVAVEALKPFADVADQYAGQEDDGFEVWKDAGPVIVREIGKALRLGNFRRAAEALAALQQEGR